MKRKIKIPKRAWTALHLALIAWVAWITAGIVDDYLAGKWVKSSLFAGDGAVANTNAEPDESAYDYSRIVRRDIFNSAARVADEDYVENSEDKSGDDVSETAPKTTLPVTLLGTIIDPEGGFKLAAIKLKDTREEGVYRERDELLSAKIVKIERNRVYIKRGHETELLTIDFDSWDKGGKKEFGTKGRGKRTRGDISMIKEGQYEISRRYMNAQLANMSQLLTQVRAVPNIGSGGQADGFKLFSIKKGSFFEQIGLKNRDIIKQINGVPLNSAEKGLELFQALRNETEFSVDLERNKSKTSLQFTIQ